MAQVRAGESDFQRQLRLEGSQEEKELGARWELMINAKSWGFAVKDVRNKFAQQAEDRKRCAAKKLEEEAAARRAKDESATFKVSHVGSRI